MQTLSIQVEDDYIQQFMNFVNNSHSNITVSKDKNLELDLYFYERQKQLQEDIDDIDSGKTQMINNEDFWNEIDTFTQSLQK